MTIERLVFNVLGKSEKEYRIEIETNIPFFKKMGESQITYINSTDSSKIEAIENELKSNYTNKTIDELIEQGRYSKIGFIGEEDKLEIMEGLIGKIKNIVEEINEKYEKREILKSKYKRAYNLKP